MAWPFYFDADRMAEMFNSVFSTLIAASLIFLFVYYNRKKPILKVENQNIMIGSNGATQLIADPIQYNTVAL